MKKAFLVLFISLVFASNAFATGEHTHALTDLSEKSYNSLTDKPTIPTALSDLTSDSTHRTVTDIQISTWNAGGGSGIAPIDFDNADLVNGIITLNHQAGQKYVTVSIYDNNDHLIEPTLVVLVDSNNCYVDLNPWAPISGTWHAVITL
jgi:hypothetical protein